MEVGWEEEELFVGRWQEEKKKKKYKELKKNKPVYNQALNKGAGCTIQFSKQ